MRLAKGGIATIVPDLYGTGDSEGDFSDGDWMQWQQDLVTASNWSASEGWPVSAMLAIRLGCALAVDACRQLAVPVERTVFWAPVLDGRRFLTQYLRLRVAASMMDAGGGETVSALRERIENGETLEVSGYALAASLARQIDCADASGRLSDHLGALHWMEIVRSDSPVLPEAAAAAIKLASSAMRTVVSQAIPGDPFWSSTEIVVNAKLIDTTVAALVHSA
jgi:exosortase A-associated hydrolase 2